MFTWLFCMIFMVQGNVLQLTKHAIIATKRCNYRIFSNSQDDHFKLPILMFIGCFIADLLAHPTILEIGGPSCVHCVVGC